jgi:hypothetical protein
MLKALGIIALVSAAIFAAAVVGLMIGYSWQPASHKTEQQTTTEQKTEESERENEKPFWQRATTDPIAAFTLWLVIFTAVLGITSVFQLASLNRSEDTSAIAANAARDAAETSRTALIAVQRAFVFIDSFEADVVNNQLIVIPKWRNSGSTPTKFMINYVNWRTFAGEPPDNFTFPDLDAHGNTLLEADVQATPMFVGPNAIGLSDQLVELLPVLKTPRLGVFIEPEVGHGKTEVHEGVQG